METGPPVLIERVVRLLTPPACREYVLGDLCERYRSPSQYVRDAAHTVPLVVASRIRRTASAPLLVVQGLCVFYGFVDVSLAWSNATPAATAAVAAVTILIVREAYRAQAPTWPQAPARDALVAVAGALPFYVPLEISRAHIVSPVAYLWDATPAFLLLFAVGVLWSRRLSGRPAARARVVYVAVCAVWSLLMALGAAAVTGFASGIVFSLIAANGGQPNDNLVLRMTLGTLWAIAPLAGTLFAIRLCVTRPRWGLIAAGKTESIA